jgi:hypothetical protein
VISLIPCQILRHSKPLTNTLLFAMKLLIQEVSVGFTKRFIICGNRLTPNLLVKMICGKKNVFVMSTKYSDETLLTNI